MTMLLILFNLTGCNEEETTRQREYLASNERIAAVNAASNVDADIKIAEISFMERSKTEIQRLISETATEAKRLETKLGIEKIQQESSIVKTKIWQPVALIVCSGTFILGLVLIWGKIWFSLARERTIQGLPLEERVKVLNGLNAKHSTPPCLSQAAYKRLEKQASIH